MKSGAGSPGATGGRLSVMVMSSSFVVATVSAEKRKHHQRVGLEPGPLAHLLRLRQVGLGLRLVAGVEIQGRQAVVAWEQELRLSDLLGQAERFFIRGEGLRVLAVALVDLAED